MSIYQPYSDQFNSACAKYRPVNAGALSMGTGAPTTDCKNCIYFSDRNCHNNFSPETKQRNNLI